MDTEVVCVVFVCCLMALELLDDVEVLTVMLTRASDILGPILGMIMQHRCKVDARVFGYAEEVVPRYQLNDFRRHFRVQRSTFAILVRLLSPHAAGEACLIPRRGRPPVCCEKQLLITLWILANQEALRSVGDRFGVCEATVYRTVRRTVILINKNLTPYSMAIQCSRSFVHQQRF